MRPIARVFMMVCLGAGLLAAPVAAQFPSQDTLRILRFDTSGFPTIRVHVRAFCQGVQAGAISPINARVVDGGVNRAFTLSCPTQPVPISVAFALDRSGSVSGTSLYRIQEGAWSFVNLMQSRTTGNDEAAIITFNEDWYREQGMTSDKRDLLAAIQRMFAFGNTAIWDATWQAIAEVRNFGINPVKAVIVLSDGGDNSSATSLQDVIAYARAEGIPVYTICITYHAAQSEEANMRMLADSTGGMYFPVDDPDAIVDVFNQLASAVAAGANDCVFEYDIECPDGSWREAEITLQACNGLTLREKHRYRAPLSPNLWAVTLRVDSASAYEDGDVYIPITISSQGGSTTLTRLAFKVYEYAPLRFVEAITRSHLAEAFSGVDIRDVSDSLLVMLTGNVTLLGTDTLMVLRYHADAVPGDSTVPIIVFDEEKQTTNCMLLKVEEGNVRIRPRPLLGTACGDTVSVRWDPAAGMFDPAIVHVSASITNTGAVDAANPRAWIALPYGVSLAGGSDTVSLGIPLLAAGGRAQAQFDLRVAPVDTAREYRICVSFMADSARPVVCCSVLRVEAGRPAMRAVCSMPREVRWVDSLGRYVPDVFPVTLTVTNISPVTARASEAWIHLPAGFRLEGGPGQNASVTPPVLTQNASGAVTWMVRALDRMTSDTVDFCIKTAAGNDTAVCCQRVYITKSPVRAALVCDQPRAMTWDEDKKEWDPSILIVSTVVRNTSGNVMTSAQGRITLPPFLRLAPSETYLKDLPGGAVVQPGDSVTVSWILSGSAPPAGATDICIDIMASNFPGARCCIPIVVQSTGAAPVLACTLTGPDTIRYNDTGYAPNPFRLGLEVRNTGNSHARLLYSALLQGADLSIEAPDQSLKLITDSLAAGAAATAGYNLRVLDRTVARMDTIRVTVYAANGGAMVCEKRVFIEAVRGPAIELSCSGPDSLIFSDSLNTYLPSPFVIALDARNTGTATADSIVAEFLPPANIELVAGEQAAKLLAPPALAPGDRGSASWQANAVLRSSARMDTVRAQVRLRQRTTSPIIPCPIPIHIPAARAAALDLTCMEPPVVTIVDGRYAPDSIIVRVRVRNTGDARAFDPLVTLLAEGRLALASGQARARMLPSLSPGSEMELAWVFTATPTAVGDTAAVCFSLGARFQRDQTCCVRVWLPPIGDGSIALACEAPDTVRYDIQAGRYPNPVIVTARVTNTSQVRIDSVLLAIALPGGIELSPGDAFDRVLYGLDPGRTLGASWSVDVVADTTSVITARRIRWTAYAAGDVRICERMLVVVPPVRDTALGVIRAACSAPDTIRYIDPQRGLQPSPFPVTVLLTNDGATVLNPVSATLTLPAGITFASGESPTKALPTALTPGQQGALSWSCIPALADTQRVSGFEIIVDAGAGVSAWCATDVSIEGAISVIEVRVPTGLLGRVGELVDIPLQYRNPQQAVIRSFAVSLTYDPAVLTFERGFPRTLAAEWDGVTATSVQPGLVRFSAASTVPLGTAGILAGAVMRVTSGNGTDNAFGVGTSDLQLEGMQLPRGVEATLLAGDITTMGDCLLPLREGGLATLRPATPNPFNPTTRIAYDLPPGEARQVELTVYDSFGRKVRELDAGLRREGSHAVMFDAGGLPSGVYFCRLTIDDVTLVRGMVLAP